MQRCLCRVSCVKQLDRRWKVLLVTAVAVFMAFLDVTIVNVAFPSIEKAFPSTSLAGLSWVLNASGGLRPPTPGASRPGHPPG
jgi:hypothetical protein